MLQSMDFAEKSRRYEEYVRALEEERSKIEVFQRELPLCLQLVSQTIENVKSQIEGFEQEETVSDGRPVLEEFIPLKPTGSCSSGQDQDLDQDQDQACEVKKSADLMERSETKSDWMQSVQLWSNQAPDPPLKDQAPFKPVALNATKSHGAFHPFQKQQQQHQTKRSPCSSPPSPSPSAGVASSSAGATARSPEAAARSPAGAACCSEEKQEKEKERESAAQRKSRRCWSPELHRRFLQALQQLGGSQVATPKQIREHMKVDGLTNDEVKSHLQKYRLHTRRPNSVQSSTNNNSQTTPQFVVVGGIWVPPSDYSTTITTTTTATTTNTGIPVPGEKPTRPSTIYTPIAVKHDKNRQIINRQTRDANVVRFASPSTSSSSQTTTASPQC